MVITYNKKDDTVSIQPEKLRWILSCARDILKKDLEYYNGDPMSKIVQTNLDEVQKAINFIDKL